MVLMIVGVLIRVYEVKCSTFVREIHVVFALMCCPLWKVTPLADIFIIMVIILHS